MHLRRFSLILPMLCFATAIAAPAQAQTAGEGSGGGTVGSSSGMTTSAGSAAEQNGPQPNGAPADAAKRSDDVHRSSGTRSPSTNTE